MTIEDLPPAARALLMLGPDASVDVMEFARAYGAYAREHGTDADMATAGIVILRAWMILNRESRAILDREQPIEPAAPPQDADPFAEMVAALEPHVLDEGLAFTERVLGARGADVRDMLIGAPLRPPSDRAGRRATAAELVELLAEAQAEAVERAAAAEARRARVRERRARTGGAIVVEDLQRDMADLLARLPAAPVSLRALAATRSDMVSVLVAALHLHQRGEVRVWQDEFPMGPVMVARRGRA